MTSVPSTLTLKKLNINTYYAPIIYLHENSHICRSEGFVAEARVEVVLRDKSLIATLHTVRSNILHCNEAGLSTYAWNFFEAKPGDVITVSHPKPLDSLSYIRSKVYGNTLKHDQINAIITDLVAGRLSDIQIAMFLAGSVAQNLNQTEVLALTRAMVDNGKKLSWDAPLVVDKHCVGGLPGNRTTLIVVPIVAAFGLMMPKTSSRAITSPAGTADTMEIFSPVNLNYEQIKKVVTQENACIVWGGNISLSPADDLLIRVERSMNLDGEGQLVASVLSKKISSGSNHLVIDIPVGPTAKVRNIQQAELIKTLLESTASAFSIKTTVIISDGTQPVGRGIGPALEARDVLAVLTNDKNAPLDLKDRALTLAGHILEFSSSVQPGTGKAIAQTLLESGKAFEKFLAICIAQGGSPSIHIPTAKHTYTVAANQSGKIIDIDNRKIATIAKLAGAPVYKASGVELLAKINTEVKKSDPLFVVYSESRGALNYAITYLTQGHNIMTIGK